MTSKENKVAKVRIKNHSTAPVILRYFKARISLTTGIIGQNHANSLKPKKFAATSQIYCKWLEAWEHTDMDGVRIEIFFMLCG